MVKPAMYSFVRAELKIKLSPLFLSTELISLSIWNYWGNSSEYIYDNKKDFWFF